MLIIYNSLDNCNALQVASLLVRLQLAQSAVARLITDPPRPH